MKYFLKSYLFFLFLSSISFAQWIPQDSGTNKRLLTIFFLNENLGWAAGDKGCILKTTNGGIDWKCNSLGSNYTVHAIQFLDSLTGWAILYTYTPKMTGYIIATNDGGVNWFYQYYIDWSTLHNIHFYNHNFGYAVGSRGTFLRTVDGGLNWKYIDVGSEWIYGIYFINQNVGFVSQGHSGKILKTTDGGLSWQPKWVPTNSTLYSIFFINNNNGWAAGERGEIIKTTDSGNTWLLQNTIMNQTIRDIKFINDNEGWAVSLGGNIFHTNNGGLNWELQNVVTNDLYGVSLVNNKIGWAAGNNGAIYKTIDADTKQIHEDKNYLELPFSLSQNYPNPFDVSTKISYTIAKIEADLNPTPENLPQSVQLIIYDSLGNKIVTLVNERKKPGTYEEIFNPGFLKASGDKKRIKPGVYFYRLQVGDPSKPNQINFMKTKKMLFSK